MMKCVLIFALIVIAMSDVKVLDSGVVTENVDNEFGKYIIIYDHEITTISNIIFNVVNEVHCRLIAAVHDYWLSSVSRGSDGKVDCRMSRHWIKSGIVFTPKEGATTFFKSWAGYWWPHTSGIFYQLNKQTRHDKNYTTMKAGCPTTNRKRMPVTRTDLQKKNIMRIVKDMDPNTVFVDTYKHNGEFYWSDDDTPFTEPIGGGDDDHLVFIDTGEYRTVSSGEKMHHFCIYRPFGPDIVDWDY